MEVVTGPDQEKIASAVLASMPAPQRKLIEKIADSPGDEAKEPIEPAAPKEAKEPPKEPEREPEAKEEPKEPEKTKEPEPDPRFVEMAKSLQSLQQEIKQLNRKKESQGELNEVQEAKLHAATKKADKLGEKLKDFLADDPYAMDVNVGVKTLAQTSMAIEERLQRLESENQQLRQKEEAGYWDRQSEKFDGVNVSGIWETAIGDALKQSGVARAYQKLESGQMSKDDFEELLRGQASDLYHERVRTAKASVDAKKKAPAPEPKAEAKPPTPQTARTVPPPSPGGNGTAQNAGASQGQNVQSVRDAQLLEFIERKLAY